MDPLWLLRGKHDVPGWQPLEKHARANEIDVIIFDRDAWALMRAAEPPTQYEGFEIVERNDRKLGPFRVRLESGPNLPFTGVSRGGDQPSRALVGGLTPFVFLHDSWSREACDLVEPLTQ